MLERGIIKLEKGVTRSRETERKNERKKRRQNIIRDNRGRSRATPILINESDRKRKMHS